MTLGSLRRRVSLRVLVLGITLLSFVLVVTGVIALLTPNRAFAASSILTILDGTVLIKHAGSTSFELAADGQTVQAGDALKTEPDSHAVLTYFDGSIAELEPASELVIEALTATASGDIVVLMQQTAGHTWHVVARALSPNSRYEVRTPAATAAVRGTAFEVKVNRETGETEVSTTEGTVAASTRQGSVDVGPGMATVVSDATKAPPPPAPVRAAPTVTVQVNAGAAPVTLVTNNKNQSVGVSGDKVVRYAPGSTVEKQNGNVVVKFRGATGTLATVVKSSAGAAAPASVDVQVRLTDEGGRVVAEGKSATVETAAGTKVGGFEIKPPEAGKPAEVTPLTDVSNIKDPKVGKAPEQPTPPPVIALRFGTSEAQERQKKIAEDQKRAAEQQKQGAEEQKKKAAEAAAEAAEEQGKAAEAAAKAAEAQKKADEERQKAATEEQRKAAEAAQRAAGEQQKAAEAAAKAAEEQGKAAEAATRAAEAQKKAAEERLKSTTQQEQAVSEEEKKKAEEQKQAAIEEQRRALEAQKKADEQQEQARLSQEAKRKAEADEAKRKAEAEAKRKAEEEAGKTTPGQLPTTAQQPPAGALPAPAPAVEEKKPAPAPAVEEKKPAPAPAVEEKKPAPAAEEKKPAVEEKKQEKSVAPKPIELPTLPGSGKKP